jgi:hypothetical protein
LAFVFIVAVAIAALLQFGSSQRRLTRMQIEREAVYYAAEAGIDQVIHLFNYPGDWTSDAALFAKDSGSQSYFDSSGDNVFESRLGGSALPLIGSGVNEDLIVFTNGPLNGQERVRVSALTLTLPEAGDPADAIVVINSTARNPRGVERQLRAVIAAAPTFGGPPIPAAVISHVDGGSNGQMNVHWGEAWTRADLEVNNMSNITTTSDPWTNFRTEDFFMKSNGKYATGYGGGGGFSDSPLVPADPNYNQPWLGYDADHTNVFQQWDFTQQFADAGITGWDDLHLDYSTWKLAAQSRGNYYSTDSSGNIYRGSVQNPSTLVSDFGGEIDQSSAVSVDTGTPGSQTLPEPLIIFVDTTDGNPPAADGSNHCDISITGGGGDFTRGLLYICGDFYSGGAGSPPQVWIQDPELIESGGASGSQHLESTRFMGLIYTSGSYTQQGNPITYGAVLAEEGFGTGGTPDIWYDARLKTGLPFAFNSEVSVALWAEIPIDVY